VDLRVASGRIQTLTYGNRKLSSLIMILSCGHAQAANPDTVTVGDVEVAWGQYMDGTWDLSDPLQGTHAE
jgi:hypothetical protein